MSGLRFSVLFHHFRCFQSGKRCFGQPAIAPNRVFGNARKSGRNEFIGSKKKRGIRDILGNDLKSPSAPLSAPFPQVLSDLLIKVI